MPTGHIKVFDRERNFGFVTTESGEDVFLPGEAVSSPLHSGDEVEFEMVDRDGGGQAAASIKVVKAAPEDNPIGRTMTNPPSWDELEERERQRRAARRRRR